MRIVKFTGLMTTAVLLASGAHAQTAEGLISVKSRYSVGHTIDRFEQAAKARDLNVFARIDHAAGAQKSGRNLRPTELLIFGSPQAGTPLMECSQSIGIDLPLKAMAWQDASGQVWLSYNDLQYLQRRHGISQCGEFAKKIGANLEGLARQAVQ